MPFKKHPINFDACRYIARCSGGYCTDGTSIDPKSKPQYVHGFGRPATAKVTGLNGTLFTNASVYFYGSGDSSSITPYLYRFQSVFSRFLDQPKYYFLSKSNKQSLVNSDGSGQIAYNAARSISAEYTGEYYTDLGTYGRDVYYKGCTRIMCGLTDEEFSDEKNDYELLSVTPNNGNILWTDLLFNDNGRTQLRFTLTATTNEAVTIKGMPLYTTAHRYNSGINISSTNAGGSCIYLVNIGYVEFDAPIAVEANKTFTVDVIFEFET